jgi:hypothetical protein
METATQRATLERVLEAIARETGLATRVVQWEPKLHRGAALRPDALIEIGGPNAGQQYAVEAKNIHRFEILHQLRALWPRGNKPPLLVAAPYITTEAAEQCRKMDLYFADTVGNIYLKGRGLHVFVTGKRNGDALGTTKKAKLANPAGLKVVFALLCKPGLLNAPYRQIAAVAQVALGAIGPVIKELETRKFVAPAATGRRGTARKFLDPQRVVQEWAALYPAVLRPKLNLRRFRAQPNWTDGLELKPYHALWGGEVAANRLLHYLKPETTTIYARETPKQLVADHRLRVDATGDVEVLDVFWNLDQIPATRDVVPPILAYADLTATTNGRNLEAARMIYEQFVEPALRNPA